MPRKARKYSNTGIYHIMLRGINRQTIFQEERDYIKLIEIIQQCKEKSGFELYGYCIMGNHVHLLLREEKESVSLAMQRICSSFVYWYNGKYDRVGHLFQERYKSEVVEDEAYLITVLRYIHQNPLKADMVNTVAAYKWSSYHEYIHRQNIVDIEFILKLFAAEKQMATDRFEKYMNENNEDVCLDYKEKHRITDEEIIQVIEEKYGVKKDFFHLVEREQKDRILKDLKARNGATIRQLVRVTGVSKSIVEKA